MSQTVVIGAGVAGLVAAYRLAKAGEQVTVVERASWAGGQLATTEVNGTRLEWYYHHAFTSDTALWELCDELGIQDIGWYPSSMGYFCNGRVYPFGTPSSLIGFHPLGIWGRIQFVISTLRLMKQMTQTEAENWSIEAWFRHHGYARAWDVIWKPLFRLKFSTMASHISLVWLWGKLNTRGRSRKGSKEMLAYMHGSFGRLADALVTAIQSHGGTVLLNTGVVGVRHENGCYSVKISGDVLRANRVISTVSADLMATLFPWSPEGKAHLERYTYTAAICMMIISNRAWMTQYWTNVGDDEIPFGGIIEHTNMVNPVEYGCAHITYLSRYLMESDPLWGQTDDEIIAQFLCGFKKIVPEFDRDAVSDIRIFRQRNAQPIVPKGYVSPTIETELPNVYWISTHHTYPYDRGVNYAITLAKNVVSFDFVAKIVALDLN